MDLNKKLEELKPYQLNCNVFDVYSYNGLSMQDLLCQFFTKINECIDVSNETIDLAKWLVNEGLELEVAKKLVMWLEDGTLENIINVSVFNTLNEKISNLGIKIDKLNNNLTYYIDNYEDIVVNDDWSIALKYIIDNAKHGATIIFGNKTYNFKTTTTTNKSIQLKGQGANNTICVCSPDVTLIELRGTQSNYNSLGCCGVSNMTINGDIVSLKPLILFSFVAIGYCENLVLNNCGGGGINFYSSQDISLLNIYIRRCGNSFRNFASINFLQEQGATSSQNCNEIKFINSTFEHNKGRLVISDGLNNNSLSFIGCKFEYNNEGVENLEEPIFINGGDRISFDSCRYTYYPSNGCFKFINVTNSKVEGQCFNKSKVETFININNCINIDVKVTGRKTGVLKNNGSSYFINSNIVDRELINYTLTNLVPPGVVCDMNKIYYRDEGASFTGNEVFGGGVNKKIIYVKISNDDIQTGITIYIRAKSTISKQYRFVVRDKSNIDVYSQNVNISNKYSWCKFVIPFEYCRNGAFSFYISQGVDDSILYVNGIYYENKVSTQNTTPTFTGIKGDIVWNSFPTTGDVIGWVCTSTGVNWKGFGTVL